MAGHDPTDLDAQERRARDAQNTAQVDEEARLADVKWLMEQPEGRRFMWRLLDEAGVYRSTFNESHAVMALNEGKRMQGLRLVIDINRAAPAMYDLMKKEAARKGT